LPANNVLLYGDRGTGKSSTVKAIANEYREQGLRIIEIPRKYLVDFPAVLKLIKEEAVNLLFLLTIWLLRTVRKLHSSKVRT